MAEGQACILALVWMGVPFKSPADLDPNPPVSRHLWVVRAPSHTAGTLAVVGGAVAGVFAGTWLSSLQDWLRFRLQAWMWMFACDAPTPVACQRVEQPNHPAQTLSSRASKHPSQQ